MKGKTHDLNHDLTFSAHTNNCVCHSIRSMFRVLGDWLKDGNVSATTFLIWIFLYEFCFKFGSLAIEDHVHILG